MTGTQGSGSPADQVSQPISAQRWAMVVDLQACRREEGCRDCIDACHRVHNVPDLPDPEDEVKWIWKERFEEAFPGHEHDYLPTDLRHQEVLVFCNHCDNPPCVTNCLSMHQTPSSQSSLSNKNCSK